MKAITNSELPRAIADCIFHIADWLAAAFSPRESGICNVRSAIYLPIPHSAFRIPHLGRRIVALLFLAALVLSLASAPAASQEPSRGLWGKRQSISARLKQVRDKLRTTKRKQRNVTHQLWRTETRIRDTRTKVVHTRTRLRVCESRLDATRRRLREARERLKKQNVLLSGRLADMYTGEHIAYLNLLLNSTDIWTLLSRAYYVEQVVAADVRLIHDIEETKADLETDESLQRRQTTEVAALHDALKQQHNQQCALADDQRDLLDRVTHDRALYERALAELEQESRQIEAMIRSLQKTTAGAKRLAQQFIGGLSRPVPGRINSGFGYRMHPIIHKVKFHTGVDLDARSGAPIHAAADGIVIMAGWRRGYGNTVVIDHGGGVSTLYGHCSSILVSGSQQVSRGQTIARVGSTGLSTGPHLHFERRQNGKPVSPL